MDNSQPDPQSHTAEMPEIIYKYRIAPKPHFEYVSPSVTAVIGYTPHEHYADPDLGFKVVHPQDGPMLRRLLASADSIDGPVVLRWLSKDGRLVWTSHRIIPIRDSAGSVVAIIGIARDISKEKAQGEELLKGSGVLEALVRDRTAALAEGNEALRTEVAALKRTEQELGLLLAVTRAISEAEDFFGAIRVVLQKICEATNWIYGEAWVPGPDGGDLECSPAWYTSSRNLETFRRLSEGSTFPPGVGLPGRVWEQKKPEWIEDVSIRPQGVFARAEVADEAGLKAALGTPIIAEGQVLAVLVFFMLEPLEESQRHIDLVSAVATQLGSVIRHKQMEEALSVARAHLEERIRERTATLTAVNESLQAEITERRRAEEELRENEERYRSLVQHAPVCIHEIDLSGRLTSINQAGLQMMGKRNEAEVIGLAYLDLVRPQDRERIGSLMAKAFKGEESEFGFTLESGAASNDFVSCFIPIKGSDGAVLKLMGITLDTTERNRAIEALQQERDFAESLIDTAQVIVLVLDTQGRIVRFNRCMEKISGYGLHEVQGKDWFSTFLPERDRPRIRDLFFQVVHQGATRGLNPIVTKDGHEREIEWSNTTLGDGKGNLIGVLAIGQDITERKKAESWLHSVIDTTQDALISIDRKNRIVMFNPAAERIFGYAKAEVEGEKVNLLMADPYAGEHDDYIARYERTGQARAIGRILTVRARRKNGQVFPIELSVTEVETEGEVRYAAFIRDISEKTRLQEQLLESERLAAIGATAAKLAHEIANPLNGMSLTVQLLEQRLVRRSETVEEAAQSTVEKLKEEIGRLHKLLDGFSSLSRREKYSFRPTALGPVIEEVLGMELPRCAQLGITVERSFGADLPLVVADKDRLKQALWNLCKNAAEAMPHGGKLSVRAALEGKGVVVEVADNGIGIPDGINLFEPFSTTKQQGTGLGLVVVRQIVVAHGGTVTYSSEPGKGTVFCITLPLYPSSPEIL